MSRRDDLKVEAEALNLEYRGNISSNDLEALIDEAKQDSKANAEEASMNAKEAKYMKPDPEVAIETKKEVSAAKKKASARKESMRMVKCIITPLSENMRELPSEMYSVNAYGAGFVKKVVRFNTETIEPVVVLNFLREKKALIQVKSKNKHGREIVRKQLAPAFSIQELPLTDEDIAQFNRQK